MAALRMNKSMALPRRLRLRVGGISQAVTVWPTLVRPWTSAGFAMGVVFQQVSVTAMATSWTSAGFAMAVVFQQVGATAIATS